MSIQQIKIISDGTSYGTQVLDVDGCPIHGITSVTVTVESGGLARAVLTFDNVFIEMKAHAELPADERIDGSE